MKCAVLFLIAAAFSIGSCSHRVPTATVELIDTSLSIRPRAEASALDAVRKQIEEMGRGDRLILIPVTGDARNDAGGRVLRLEAPTIRESYDSDLRRFEMEATTQFNTWAAMHGAQQRRTDLLGSVEVARQELASVPSGFAKRLLIVSDFIEDDREFDFATDYSVAHPRQAHELAAKLRQNKRPLLTGVTVCLGRLESSDFGVLAKDRRQAIDAFWAQFLEGDSKPDLQIDGIGLLQHAREACPAAPTSQSDGGRQ